MNFYNVHYNRTHVAATSQSERQAARANGWKSAFLMAGSIK